MRGVRGLCNPLPQITCRRLSSTSFSFLLLLHLVHFNPDATSRSIVYGKAVSDVDIALNSLVSLCPYSHDSVQVLVSDAQGSTLNMDLGYSHQRGILLDRPGATLEGSPLDTPACPTGNLPSEHDVQSTLCCSLGPG
jgi:hypothetical protein